MASLYILHNPLVLCKFFCKKSYGISKNIPHPPKYFLFSIEILQQTKGFLGGFYEIISLYNFTITFHPSRFIGISYNIGLYGKKTLYSPMAIAIGYDLPNSPAAHRGTTRSTGYRHLLKGIVLYFVAADSNRQWVIRFVRKNFLQHRRQSHHVHSLAPVDLQQIGRLVISRNIIFAISDSLPFRAGISASFRYGLI